MKTKIEFTTVEKFVYNGTVVLVLGLIGSIVVFLGNFLFGSVLLIQGK